MFSCCIPVKGAERSLICDLQRGSFDFIPNGLYEMLIEHDGKSIFDLKSLYSDEHDKLINEYFHFLKKNEYIFHTNNPNFFPLLDLKWNEPNLISNVIIDLNENSIVISWENLIKRFRKFRM